MKAKLIYHSKITLIHTAGDSIAIAELKVWNVGVSPHYPDGIKYGMFLVHPHSGSVIFGMDNHKPKGPHLHLGDREEHYDFVSIDDLIEDFWRLATKKGYRP